MATRSTIGFLNNNNEVVNRVYCHSDGYLNWNGIVLMKVFRSKRKIKKLLSFGDISVLNPKIKPIKEKIEISGMKTTIKRYSKFYHRDFNDKLSNKLISREEYNYIFFKGDFYVSKDDSKVFYKLSLRRVSGKYIITATDTKILALPTNK